MELQKKIDLIKNNEAVALLAPTFCIDFKYPNIIGMLENLGFKEVTELTFGARMVNWAYANYIKENPDQPLFISSPCPTVVAMIQTQYPELVKYLMPVVSPMIAMAKIYKQKHPNRKVVFISPCWAKENVEAPKWPEFIDAVITLKDLKTIFEKENIKEEDFNRNYKFDSFIREYTKIYPVSGGLASTSHIKNLFKDGEILITDGVENIKKALEDFKAGNSKYKFLDLLNCDGGCIGGPAINNKDLPTEKKKNIVLDYTKSSSEDKMGEKRIGTIEKAEDIDLATKF
jgi:iron only hydrogenase large subunit-like protein